MAVQSRSGHAGRVESALERETGFLGRIIKRADDEIFARMSTRAPREFFIFRREPLNNFRPRNVRARSRPDRDPNDSNSEVV